MRKYLLGAALTLAAMNASACTFSWHTYGDNAIRSRMEDKIGAHVPEQYCKKFNKDHQIVVQFNAYTLSNMCVGHAIVSLRKRGTTTLQVNTRNSVITDTNCRTSGGANELAAQASLSALDDLMSELDTWTVK
ncbi:hypothetical protein [Pseudoduganella sp.]|uniref:hypothetical protein n=1 Tax=Pseudoduganella sp. TaxID=1880898 RepID=UPI0035B071B8